MKFSSTVVTKLKYYVYLYSHPKTGEVFYVGKGKDNRAFAHLDDARESEKVAYINDLRAHGLQPKIEILIHGLDDEQTALRVESSVIDLIGINQLMNVQSGYHSSTFGRMDVAQIMAAYEKRKVVVEDPAILIRINQAFRYSMSAVELYDYTRGQWRLNPDNARRAKYALSVYSGIVQEVYEIRDWYEAGTTFSIRADNANIERGADERMKGRYEFIGNIANEPHRSKYRHGSVQHYFEKGNSNPILYAGMDKVRA